LNEYNCHHWKPLLAANNLNSFDAIWNLKTDWFEEPNIRRGGWSGVVKLGLETPQGKVDIFIKRQENHISKTFFHPFRGIATFQKEFHNILRLNYHKIPTLELIYFGQRNLQVILITKSLDGYCALDSTELASLNQVDKRALLLKVATATTAMHQCRFQHNCFYPKHIFVKQADGQWDVRFIDLEKLKRTVLKKQAVIRDLSTLHRHANENWTIKDRVYFFKAYVNENKLSKRSKNLWQVIEKKLQAKRK
jgi:hypothetical protein